MKKATWRVVISAVAMLGIATTQLDVRAFAQQVRKEGAVATPVKISAIRWSDRSAPAAPRRDGSKKKWIFIAVAAGGGAAAAYFLLKKDPVPVITVGPPTIGFHFGHR